MAQSTNNRGYTPEMTIKPVTLAFRGECEHLEPRFLHAYNGQTNRYIRLAFAVGIFFYAIFGVLDQFLVPEKTAILWFIRYVVVCPAIFVCILLTFWSGFLRWTQLCIFFVVLLAGSGISVMVAIIPPPASFSYYAGVILVMMMSYGFVRARFIWASLANWINVIIYEIVAIGVVDTPISILVNNNFFFISANIIGMFSCYAFEYYARRDFFMARVLSAERKKVTELNRDLEQKIAERTSELQRAYDTLQKEGKEREELQSQFLHVQKMESVGRLAGGIAHDFNNIISVIIGFSELAMRKAKKEDPIYRDLKEISKAANRSSDITRQLLAFARKETIEPTVIDINRCIEKMLTILRRLIGEDITLTWVPADGPLPVLMDRSQLEQLLANLCANARDAIADVGELIIETGTREVEYCPVSNAELRPGSYVALIISDNGKGMDRETLDHIFEPFYTTKGVGQGTGLGLATVLGAVEQNNGFVNVYSQPGIGTTFKLYLPLEDRQVKEELPEQEIVELKGNGEHLLVVEDEASILALVERNLLEQGYFVYTARTPAEALEIAKIHSAEIDLLVTDVIMPEMNGRDLARQIAALNPAIKCIYMSGYSENLIAHRGVLESNLHFIHKPFTSASFSRKVRAVLDGEA